MYCIVLCFIYICKQLVCTPKFTFMKKVFLILMSVAMIGVSNSCKHKKVTRITVERNADYLNIEYSGDIVFNENNTGIIHISRNGFFKCKSNSDKLVAESDEKGNITYKVNGEIKKTELNIAGRRLLTQAIKEIAKQKAYKARS